MNRRAAITGLLASAATATSSRARAQQAKPFRIAWFPDFGATTRRVISAQMRDVGWSEGVDFIIVPSGFEFGAPDPDEAARRVVAGNPDVILTLTTHYALVLHRATTSIPIVMVACGYPVEVGLAVSLTKPGKNVTGNSLYAGFEVWGKLLELLTQIRPGVKHIGVLLAHPKGPGDDRELGVKELRTAERLLGLQLNIIEIANADQVPAALAQISAERLEALLLTAGLPFKSASTIMEFAVDNGLPTITDVGLKIAEPSPLLSYAPVYEELARAAVLSLIKILKGASPGDLPFQLPTRFELTVNPKTAKAIGLSIPEELLWRADRVIE